MPPAVLEEALRRAGATFLDQAGDQPPRQALTKADLFALGLSGGEGSKEKRQNLLKKLGLPEHLSPNAMLPVLGALYTREELLEEIERDENGVF
jgi:ribonuclease M5